MLTSKSFSFLLIIFFFSNNLISKEIHFVLLLLFIIFIIFSTKFYKTSLIVIIPLIPLMWGLVFSLDKELRDIIRDLFYFCMPPFVILLGILISHKIKFGNIIKLLIFVALVDAIIFITTSLVNAGTSSFVNPMLSRYAAGSGSPFLALGAFLTLLVLSYPNEFDYKFNRIYIFLVFTISLSALYLSGSRIGYLIFILSILILQYHKRLIKFLLFCSIGLVLIISCFPLLLKSDNVFVKKILNSVNEIVISDDSDSKNIGVNYRGFESAEALNHFLKSNTVEKFFGSGIGERIDLGVYVALGTEEMRYIPILHNGYLFILIKIGIFGILVYAIFLFQIAKKIRYYRKYSKKQVVINIIMISSLLSLLISNFVISGFFYSYNPLMFLLGYIYGYVILSNSKSINIQNNTLQMYSYNRKALQGYTSITGQDESNS